MKSDEDSQYRKKFASSEKDVLKHIQKIYIGEDNEITKQRFLVEIRNKMDKAEEELSECLKTEKSKTSCYLDYGSSMFKLNDLIKSTKDLGKLKSFYVPCVPELVDEETQRFINEINKISKERTSYGMREEITDKKSVILAWSNASNAWYPYSKTQEDVKTGKEIYSYKAKKGMRIKLDSNQILVPIGNAKARPIGNAKARPIGNAKARPIGNAKARPIGNAKARPIGNAKARPINDKDLDKLGHAASCSQSFPLYKLSFEAIWERKETPVIPGLLSWMERQTARLKEEQERKKNV